MTKSIEKFRIYERIQESFIRWMGNTSKVQQETGYPLDYVQHVIKKLRRERDRGLSKEAAKYIYGKLMESHLSALEHYNDMLSQYYGRSQVTGSICCKGPIGISKEGQVDKDNKAITKEHYCMTCTRGCDIELIDRIHVAEFELKVLDQRQACFTQVIDCAKKLGFVASDPQQPLASLEQKQQQNVLIIQDSSGEHRQTIEDFSKLDPIDAERVIKSIESRLLANQEARQDIADAKRERDRRTAKGPDGSGPVAGDSSEGGSRNAGPLSEGRETPNTEGTKKA